MIVENLPCPYNDKELRTTVVLITESKVIQLFCITDSLTVPIYQFRNFLMQMPA